MKKVSLITSVFLSLAVSTVVLADTEIDNTAGQTDANGVGATDTSGNIGVGNIRSTNNSGGDATNNNTGIDQSNGWKSPGVHENKNGVNSPGKMDTIDNNTGTSIPVPPKPPVAPDNSQTNPSTSSPVPTPNNPHPVTDPNIQVLDNEAVGGVDY